MQVDAEYDLRNPVFFTEKLNQELCKETQAYSNCYFFDINAVIASVGTRHVQEDMLTSFNHGAFLSDFDASHDKNRLETAQKASELYESKVVDAIVSGLEEIRAMVKTIRQTDMVKMVVVDLDDTLWRGVMAEVLPLLTCQLPKVGRKLCGRRF